jgi:hypothetical protein
MRPAAQWNGQIARLAAGPDFAWNVGGIDLCRRSETGA